MIEDVEQHERIGERERGVPRRERALVEERDRFAARKLEVAEDAVGEVGHLGEIALSDRAERPDLGQPVGVQRRDEMRCELGTGTGRRARECVREPERGRPHHLVGDGSALRDPVLPDEEPVVPVGGDVEHLAAADPGRDPVGRRPVRDRAVDDGTRRGHRVECGRVDLDLRTTARDGEHVLERERGAGQDDG